MQNYVITLRKLESLQEKHLLLTEKLKFWDYFDIGQVRIAWVHCYCPVNKQNTCDTVNRCRQVD